MDEREDYLEDLAKTSIRIGRVYAKYGLGLAAHWVAYAQGVLGEVAEMLRGNAEILGGEPSQPAKTDS